MWAEVTVPYADVDLVNGPSSNSWVSARIDAGITDTGLLRPGIFYRSDKGRKWETYIIEQIPIIMVG